MSIRTASTVAAIRRELAEPRRRGRTIGLVPTMGALHEGHLSLIRRARERCDVVVVSLFVNPAQFNEAADLEAYPRDEARDTELAAEAGADLLFAPPVAEVYPDGFATTVSVAGVTSRLEGAHRGASHFDGVATVVSKLFNMVAPDLAFFGQKDAQQAFVIKRFVRDLNVPVRIEVCPTVREPDGLAMSSRNGRLSAGQRERATALYRALRAAADSLAAGERDPEAATARGHEILTSTEGLELEYFELVDPDTFAPAELFRGDGEVLAVVAARLGAVRLIDNQPIHVPSTTPAAAIVATAGSNDTQEALECSARC